MLDEVQRGERSQEARRRILLGPELAGHLRRGERTPVAKQVEDAEPVRRKEGLR